MLSGFNTLLRLLLAVCFLAQTSIGLAEDNLTQLLQGYLAGNVSIEEIRALPFKEQDVLAALQAATSADQVNTALFVERAVFLLPSSANIIVTTAITATPSAVAAIVTAAATVAPGSVAAIVTAAATVAPGSAAAIVTAAATAAPDAVVAIVSAATTVAPDETIAIVAAAIDAAPDKADAIINTAPSPSAGETPPASLEETLNTPPQEGVPTKEPNPSPTTP